MTIDLKGTLVAKWLIQIQRFNGLSEMYAKVATANDIFPRFRYSKSCPLYILELEHPMNFIENMLLKHTEGLAQ